MENQNNNKIIISLLIVIIIILSILCILFATGTISFNSNNNDTVVESENNSNNNEVIGDNVNIDLSIDNVSISKDAPNTKIKVSGTINLSYDNNKYSGINLSGYCLGTNNEKYLIYGPADGRALFHNDDNKTLSLAETVNQNIEYVDGTVKTWSEIDWENVKIKYCKIDKIIAFFNGSTQSLEKSLNFEKSFN